MSGTNLDDLEKSASTAVPLSEVPAEYDAPIISTEVKEDRNKNKCLYVKMDMEKVVQREKATFTQKFTPTGIKPFIDALRDIGYQAVPIGDALHWKRQAVGRQTFERWLPIRKVGQARKR